MMRLIDADKLRDEVAYLCDNLYINHIEVYERAITDVLNIIDESPNIYPVNNGKWREYDNGFLQCNCCRMVGVRVPYLFCQDCGAEMEYYG